MAENIIYNPNSTDEEKYKELMPQLEALLDNEIPIISNLSNITAVFKDAFPKISWIGFYIKAGDKLFLGPFQGKIACTTIKIGNGVCGTSAEKLATIIVDDVDQFPGHIACDSGSKSEIVVPVFDKKNELFAVLDLDSYEYSSFDIVDKKYLEEFCKILITKIDLDKFNLS